MSMSRIKFSTVNCNKNKDCIPEIKHFFKDGSAQIIAITEIPGPKTPGAKNPYGLAANYFKLPTPLNSTVLYRAALAVAKCLPASLVPELSSPDIVTALVQVRSPVIKVVLAVSMYIDSGKPVRIDLLNKIKEYAFANKYPILLGGDANAKSVFWGHEKSNNRGEELENFIIPAGLQVAPFTASTWRQGGRQSVLDIVAYSSILVPTEFEHLPFPFSDHDYLSVTFDLQVDPIMKRNTARGDFDRYTEIMTSIKETPFGAWTGNNLDLALDEMHRVMISTFHQICPETEHKPKCPGLEWWNQDLTVLKNRFLSLEQKRRAIRSPANEAAFSLVRKEYKYAIYFAKQQAFREMLDKLSSSSDLKTLRNLSSGGSGSRAVPILPKANGEAGTFESTLDILMSEHFPKAKAVKPPPP
jgi:hypothetical protein